MKRLVLFLVLFVTPAFAQEPPQTGPTPEEQLSQDKIQFGQLLIQLGKTELEVVKLRKELADVKSPPDNGPH